MISWVRLADPARRGGSVITVQRGGRFDAIVFAELAEKKWMAGSEGFARTLRDQSASPEETAGPDTLVQLAAVYQGRRISLYRDGLLYSTYETQGDPFTPDGNSLVMFGLRHHGIPRPDTFIGSIDDARIYDRALSAAEIRGLQPNAEPALEPYAWWTFEPGKETDLTGRFSSNSLAEGAVIRDGQLHIQKAGAFLVATSGDTPFATDQEVAAYRNFRKKLIGDRSRPTYHLVNPEGRAMPADPNGAIHYKGRYHLHYIYNDGGFSYGHVSSVDLLHWRWHPVSLSPGTMGHGMFSGTAFMTREGVPAQIYHGEGSGRNQIAISQNDGLDEWKAYPINPVIQPGQDGAVIDHWDPDCWLEGDSYYAIFGGLPAEDGKPRDPTLMKSGDLKNWRYLGPFMTGDMPDVEDSEDISCPNFFKLGDRHMLLCISHTRGARYYLGKWENEKFTPDFHARMNFDGKRISGFFAPESLVTPDGRRVMWAWLVGGGNTLWDGIQSLPRELSLPEDGVLRIKPLRELERLRHSPRSRTGLTVKSGQTRVLEDMAGDTLELRLTANPGAATSYGVRVYTDSEGGNGLPIRVDPARRVLQVGVEEAPFELRPGEDLNLTVYLDRRIVEVFVNDRQAMAQQTEYKTTDLGISVFSEGGDMRISRLDAWEMAPTNPW